ncbi:MAG: glycosyltransferase family 4 protein [Pseudomonadota bacterium]
MKIGIISDYFYPAIGGITEHVYNFAKSATRIGHDVRVITPSPLNYSARELRDIDKRLLNGNVIRFGVHLPVFSNGSLSRIGIAFNIDKKLKVLFEKEKFDVIHSHSPLAGYIPLLAVKYSNTTTIGTMHTYFKSNFWFDKFRHVLAKYYDAMDGCIAVSESARELIDRYLDRKPTVIPNGIDVNVFGNTDKKIPEFSDGKINVFFIGRAETRNGLDVLIRAFSLAKKKFQNMRLIIAGDGPFLEHYKTLAAEQNCGDIHFVGRIYEERPAYYNTADIHVFPAEIATFSITVLEGLAAGKPVITTDMKSFKEIMTDGKEGFLVKYGDHEKMAERIFELAKNPELRNKMGAAARQKALNYSWENITKRVIDFYQERMQKRCR